MNESLKSQEMCKTEDYNLFSFLKENRPINRAHVNELKKRISHQNDLHLHPIITTNLYEIVDGQHRLAAAKELGVAIYYLIDDDYKSEKMHIFNTTQKRWSNEDYLRYWIERGDVNYRAFSAFQKEYDLPINAAFIWSNQKEHGRSRAQFRDGLFKFNWEMVDHEGLKKSLLFINHLKSIRTKPIRIYTHNALHYALKSFFCNGIVDNDRFFDRLDVCTYPFTYSQTSAQYIQQLVEIYNYGKKSNKISIQTHKDIVNIVPAYELARDHSLFSHKRGTCV